MDLVLVIELVERDESRAIRRMRDLERGGVRGRLRLREDRMSDWCGRVRGGSRWCWLGLGLGFGLRFGLRFEFTCWHGSRLLFVVKVLNHGYPKLSVRA